MAVNTGGVAWTLPKDDFLDQTKISDLPQSEIEGEDFREGGEMEELLADDKVGPWVGKPNTELAIENRAENFKLVCMIFVWQTILIYYFFDYF